LGSARKGCFAYLCDSRKRDDALGHHAPDDLCRGLCHNPTIPTRIGPSLAMSFGHTQKAANPH